MHTGVPLGVGKRMNAHLEAMGIKSQVVIEKTARELGGVSCLELVDAEPPKQEICCSRMLGKRLSDIRAHLNPYEARYANGALIDLPPPCTIAANDQGCCPSGRPLFRPSVSLQQGQGPAHGLATPKGVYLRSVCPFPAGSRRSAVKYHKDIPMVSI